MYNYIYLSLYMIYYIYTWYYILLFREIRCLIIMDSGSEVSEGEFACLEKFPFYWESARALSSLRGLRGGPAVPPLCRETQSLGQQISDSKSHIFPNKWVNYTQEIDSRAFFNFNGIWSWWLFSFRFWTVWNSIFFKIERKTVLTIIFHSISK